MKISGSVVSKKAISLSRAAKLICRFAAFENGSSPAVSLYLQRASDAFNHLLQSRAKPKNDSENVERESEKETVEMNSYANKKKRKKSDGVEKSGSKTNKLKHERAC